MSTEINTNIGMESQVPEVDSAGIRIDHQRNKIRAMVAKRLRDSETSYPVRKPIGGVF